MEDVNRMAKNGIHVDLLWDLINNLIKQNKS